MNTEGKVLRMGAAVIVCALVFRLLGSGVMETTLQVLTRPEVIKTILFLETGRLVPSPPVPAPQSLPSERLQISELPEKPVEKPVPLAFSQEDAKLVSLKNTSGYDADVTDALSQPLDWELTGEAPTVLILHTHGTESYVNNESYPEDGAYRTRDNRYNVVSVGARLAEILQSQGICVLHDTTLHDYPSYDGSYNHARETVREYLEQYPSIQLVLDLHRDAITDSAGSQVGFSLSTEKGSAARMMLVMGTGSGGLNYPNWRENFALAVKLHARLEANQPGICRDLSLRSTRHNQDLMPGMVLVEMGAAGNTRQEALLSADILAQAILDLAHGAE